MAHDRDLDGAVEDVAQDRDVPAPARAGTGLLLAAGQLTQALDGQGTHEVAADVVEHAVVLVDVDADLAVLVRRIHALQDGSPRDDHLLEVELERQPLEVTHDEVHGLRNAELLEIEALGRRHLARGLRHSRDVELLRALRAVDLRLGRRDADAHDERENEEQGHEAPELEAVHANPP